MFWRSITPSVRLICDTLENISQSFYQGKVNVTFKESVFQPSSSFRFGKELIKTLEVNGFNQELTPDLFLVTGGGPERNVTFHSVKIPLMVIFKELNLVSLVAIRTAPGHIFLNIVERVRLIINIGFQNVALERSEVPSDEEIKKGKNLSDLRSKPEIKKDWQTSVAPLTNTLEQRTSWLAFKDGSFNVSIILDYILFCYCDTTYENLFTQITVLLAERKVILLKYNVILIVGKNKYVKKIKSINRKITDYWNVSYWVFFINLILFVFVSNICLFFYRW